MEQALAAAISDGGWHGGKRGGSIVEKSFGGWQAMFNSSALSTSRYFSFEKYGGREQALAAAEAWRVQTSDEHGLTKNRWKIEGGVLLVQLTQGQVMQTDATARALQLVEERVWFAHRRGGRYYVSGKSDSRVLVYFHSLYLPNCEMVDHISREPLDNRLANLRPADAVVNARNRKRQRNNTSGASGIRRQMINGTLHWAAHWPKDCGGVTVRTWSTRKYGDEGARRRALEARREACQRLGILSEE